MVLPRQLWLRAFWSEALGLFRTQIPCLPLLYKSSILFPIKLLFSFLRFSILILVCEKAVVEVGMNGTQLACGKGAVSRTQLHFGGKQNKGLGSSKPRKASLCSSLLSPLPFLRKRQKSHKTHKLSELKQSPFPHTQECLSYYYC